jgi:ADP-heptose:LPS heptosyltransferase
MHMAAAVGVPVVALFGPTHAENWGPWTPLGRVLTKPCVCNDPHSNQRCDWTKTRACLAAITVSEAQAALDEMLAMRKIDFASVV